MKKYLHLPTHTKYGWLVFIGGFIAVGLIYIATGISLGAVQIAFAIAFLIELVAIVLGKNKSIE